MDREREGERKGIDVIEREWIDVIERERENRCDWERENRCDWERALNECLFEEFVLSIKGERLLLQFVIHIKLIRETRRKRPVKTPNNNKGNFSTRFLAKEVLIWVNYFLWPSN